MNNEDNIVLTKAEAYAIRIIRMCKYLQEEKNEYIMSRQLLKSGTSIGANLTESSESISRPEFIAKTQIALKECSESMYWLRLLVATEYITNDLFQSFTADGKDIYYLLVAILKTAKANQPQR